MHDVTTPKGTLTLWLLDRNSLEIVEKRVVRNLITTAGKGWLAGMCANAAGMVGLSDIAVGTGTNAPTVGDTGLQTQLKKNALIMAPWHGSGSDANKLYARTSFDTSEAVHSALSEAGLFFGTSLFSRVLISPTLNKPNDKVMVCQWTITF